MDEICPLCLRRGSKKKMKAIQINLEEAVWLCESEECTWPMDYKEIQYIRRKIGESWSCYWNTYKPNRLTTSNSQTDWQSFVTPPYTPKTEISPAAFSDTTVVHGNHEEKRTNSSGNDQISDDKRKENVKGTKNSNSNNSISESERISEINTSITSNESFSSSPGGMSSKNCSVESEREIGNNFNSNVNHTIENPETTKVPIILNIEKASIACMKNISPRFEISMNQERIKDKNMGKNRSEISILQNSCNLEEGLKKTTPSIGMKTAKVNQNSDVPRKRNIVTSKMYEKFSFSALRRAKSLQKMNGNEKNIPKEVYEDETRISNGNEKTLNVNQDDSVRKKMNDNIEIEMINISEVSQVNEDLSAETSKSDIHSQQIIESIIGLNNDKNCRSDSSALKDTDINDLDMFLDNFIGGNSVNINENASIVTNIDDDWLKSLLN